MAIARPFRESLGDSRLAPDPGQIRLWRSSAGHLHHPGAGSKEPDDLLVASTRTIHRNTMKTRALIRLITNMQWWGSQGPGSVSFGIGSSPWVPWVP